MPQSKQLSKTIGHLQECFGEDSYPVLFDLPDLDISISSAPEYLVQIREYLNEAGAHLSRCQFDDGVELAQAPLLVAATLALNCVADFDLTDSLIECNHVKYAEIDSIVELVAICLGAVNKALVHYYETFDTSLEPYIEEFATIIYSFLEFGCHLNTDD